MSRRISIPKPNVVDRFVAYFDPVRGKERLVARTQMAIAGSWTGARDDRPGTRGWKPPVGSADADTLDDLPTLRVRSRDLKRRSNVALGACNTRVTNVVGTGLALHPQPNAAILGLTPEAAKEWAAGTAREFGTWADDPICCDLEATLNFYGLQTQALSSCDESGDVFALLPWTKKERPGSTYRLKVQMIEADRCSNENNAANTETLVEGIEKDDEGAPKTYHFAQQHPGSIGVVKREWDKVPAFGPKTGRRNVIHLYRKLRPGQTRGVPFLAPAIESLKQIADYTEAELQAALIASFFTVFVKTKSGAGINLDSQGLPVSGARPASGSQVQLAPAAIVDLAQDEEIQLANPGRPNQAAEVFLKAIYRELGAALEIPYEVLLKHFESSYSAARAALLEAWRAFRVTRTWLATSFCQPIYEAWLEEAIARGRIVAPGFFDDPAIRKAWASAEWIGDGMGQIDPLKEILAAKERVGLTVSNLSIETMEMRGQNWEEVNEGRGREIKLQRKEGTLPQAPGTKAAPPDGSLPPDQADDSEKQPQSDAFHRMLIELALRD